MSCHLPVAKFTESQKVQKGEHKIDRDREGPQKLGINTKVIGHLFTNRKKDIHSFTDKKNSKTVDYM